MISLFQITTTPPAQAVANAAFEDVNSMLQRRANEHIAGYKQFWGSSATPDAIITAMGDASAKLYLAASRENLRHLGALAALVGKTLNDVVPPQFYEPRRAFVEVDGQPLSLAAPAAGYDAWGNPIPTPES